MSEPSLDEARIAHNTGGDAELEAELLELFLTSADRYVADLAGQIADPAAWRLSAHALKGASLNFGAPPLAQLARAAEEEPPCPVMVSRLRQALEAVHEAARSRPQPVSRR